MNEHKPFCFPLSEVGPDVYPKVGCKAANLARLRRAGFPVPPGFVVTRDAYSAVAKPLSGLSPKDLQRQLLSWELPVPLTEEILAEFRRLRVDHDVPVAVRSSSTAEDLDDFSFSGLYKTALDVRSEEALMDAIRQVWSSYWSPEAGEYRQMADVAHWSHGMAVLVQQQTTPQLAGVVFTQHPIDRHANAMVIEFVSTFGDALVSGDVRAQRIIVDRESGEPLQPSESLPLSSDQLNELVSLGQAVEEFFGRAQDIEWCLDSDGIIWILQARTITTTAENTASPDASQKNVWLQAYPEPFSPFGCDLAQQRHRRWVKAINAYYRTDFKSEMRVRNGLLYYTWPWGTPSPLLRLYMGFWQGVRWLQARQIFDHFNRVALPAFLERMKTLEQARLSELSEEALVAGLNEAVEQYLAFQYDSLAVGNLAMTSASLLNRFCRLALGADGVQISGDLLSGLDNLTVERDAQLERLRQSLGTLLTDHELANLDYPALLALKDRGPSGQGFWDDLSAFQREFGYVWADRYPRDPAWRLNADALVASLVSVADSQRANSLTRAHDEARKRRTQVIQEAHHLLAQSSPLWGFPSRHIFDCLQQRAERYFPYKEDRNHYVYWAVMVIQRYARELGRRLVARQILSFPEDIFFLTWAEIQAVCAEAASDLARTVRTRKAEYERAKQRMRRRPSVAPGNVVDRSSGVGLSGEPCSPGIAAGPTRLVHSMDELSAVRVGDILVCGNLRPAWSSVFSQVAGVVVETGNLLSHGATLAREYGIPAVMNIADLMTLVSEGDYLVVDGDRGVVTIARTPDEA